jgi:hypothetical protein
VPTVSVSVSAITLLLEELRDDPLTAVEWVYGRRIEERAPRGARNGRNEMRTRLVLMAVAVAAVALPSGALAAKAATQVTAFSAKQVSPGVVKYQGRLDSTKSKCFKNRKVEIFHNGIKIAATETDNTGKFKVTGPEPPDGDKVLVKTKRKRGCKNAHKTTTYHTPT